MVLLGRDVERAWHVRGPYFTWREELTLAGTHFLLATAPHPSGRSYWWNDKANVRKAQRFFRTISGQLPG